MKRKTFLKLIPAGIGMLSVPLSCVEEPVKQKATVTITPLTDERIIAEIRAMVNGSNEASGGRTQVLSLPPCYDYDHMDAVSISGTNWVTYVAWSTQVNTSTRKKSVGIYYQNGTFKNWWRVDHSKAVINGRERHIVRYITNKDYPNNWVQGIVYMDNGSVTVVEGLNGTSDSCGQKAMDCVNEFYTNKGWFSLGLFVASAFAWGVPVGVVGGCLIGVCLMEWNPKQVTC